MRSHGRVGQSVDALAMQPDLAGGDMVKSDERPRRGRLAAARLADQPIGLARGDLERDAVDGANRGARRKPAAASRKVDAQIPDRQ